MSNIVILLLIYEIIHTIVKITLKEVTIFRERTNIAMQKSVRSHSTEKFHYQKRKNIIISKINKT